MTRVCVSSYQAGMAGLREQLTAAGVATIDALAPVVTPPTRVRAAAHLSVADVRLIPFALAQSASNAGLVGKAVVARMYADAIVLGASVAAPYVHLGNLLLHSDDVQALAAVVQEVVKEAQAAPPSSLLACITPEGCYTQALRMDADNVQVGLASPLCDCGSTCVSHMVV